MEKILPQCTKYSANGQLYSLNQKKEQEILTEVYDIGRKGLRGSSSLCISKFYSSSLQNLTFSYFHFTISELFVFFFPSVMGLARGSSLQDLVYVGLVGICDPPRAQVRESITMLMNSGVRVKMVTGDAKETAAAIGEIAVP